MDVLMPQLGETVAEGKISKWFVSAGDAVKPGDNLFEIETDKVSMEVPAIAAGTLAEIRVSAGEVAPVGAVVAVIQGRGEKLAPDKPQAPPTRAKAGVPGLAKEELDSRLRGNERSVAAAAVPRPVAMEPFREVRSPERNYGPARLPGGTVVTPLARRLAGEAGIDLASIEGSGPHGRIVARDVEQARKAPAPTAARVVAQIILTA
jgi:pyruvate dehydrogenase E2 component (dihydrolipoamide acetyltransferase)